MLFNYNLCNLLLENASKPSEEQLELLFSLVENEFNEEINEIQRCALVKKFQAFKSHLKTRWDQSSRVLTNFQKRNSKWLQLPFKVHSNTDDNEKDKTLLKRGRHPMLFEEKGKKFSY